MVMLASSANSSLVSLISMPSGPRRPISFAYSLTLRQGAAAGSYRSRRPDVGCTHQILEGDEAAILCNRGNRSPNERIAARSHSNAVALSTASVLKGTRLA